MENKIKLGLAFMAGVIVGVAGSYYYVRTKFEIDNDSGETIADDEHVVTVDEDKEEIHVTKDGLVSQEYEEKIRYNSYSSDTEEKDNKPEKDEIEKYEDGIEIIPMVDFVLDDYDYELGSWTLFSDDIMMNEYYEVVEHPEHYLGDRIMKRLYDHELEEVCVRNHNLKTVYEITRDNQTYDDFCEWHPH